MIERLIDLGCEENGLVRTNERAKHVLVFHVDSLNVNNPWKQMLAFFTGAGATREQLKNVIEKILTKLKAINIIVKLLVCDQGSNNRGLYEDLSINFKNVTFNYDNEKF